MTRREKRSESLEIRLGYSSKQAFMEACREKGVTASEVIRAFVEDYPVKPKRRAWPNLRLPIKEPVMNLSLVSLLSATLATSAILPTQSAIGDEESPDVVFERLDADGDNRFQVTTLYELAGLHPDGTFSQAMIDQVTTDFREAIAGQAEVIAASGQEFDYDEMLSRALTSAEASAAAGIERVFERMDSDGDTWVSRTEFFAFSEFHADAR